MGSKTGTEKLLDDSSKVEMGQKYHPLGMELLHPGDWLKPGFGAWNEVSIQLFLRVLYISSNLKVWFESLFLEICNLEKIRVLPWLFLNITSANTSE